MSRSDPLSCESIQKLAQDVSPPSIGQCTVEITPGPALRAALDVLDLAFEILEEQEHKELRRRAEVLRDVSLLLLRREKAKGISGRKP